MNGPVIAPMGCANATVLRAPPGSLTSGVPPLRLAAGAV